MKKLACILLASLLLLPTSSYANTDDPNFDPNIAMRDRYAIEENPNYYEFDVELTFYTDTYEENGRHDKLTASGVKLNTKTVAVPRQKDSNKPIIPYGTEIEIDGYGTKLVQDTGSRKYIKIKSDGTVILDVFIPRKSGETKSQYLTRVNNLGRVKSKARVYI